MTSIIAVANQKGGVGKTTTSINLSASLAVAERKVLLVDLDPQANATSGIGIEHASDEQGMYEVLIGFTQARDIRKVSELANLHVLPSGENLAAVELELAGDEERHLKLKQQIGDIIHEYDYVVIDCPPSLGVLTLNALFACNKVLVPLQCEYYALEGLSRLLSTIELVRQAGNNELDVHGILLTMFDSRNNLAHQVADDVRHHFPDWVFNTVIPRNVRLSEAPSFGKPVIFYDATSSGAKQYLRLAEEVLGRFESAAQ